MNDNHHELIGVKINNIVIIEIIKVSERSISVKGECVCGKIIETTICNLKNRIKSCGCKKGNLKHNLSGSKLYRKYQSMKERCYNENNIMHYRYGGRGIEICEEWLKSFNHFHKWAYNNGYEEGLSLERIDVNGSYEPLNCKWIPLKEQAKNKDKENLSRVMGKEVLQIDMLTNRVINIFPNIKSAELYIGKKGIDNVLRNKNNHCGGYYWRFANIENEKGIRRKRKRF